MRITETQAWLMAAQAIAMRSTCVRRQVGCVGLNSDGKVLATGYNGVPKQYDHCVEKACSGAHMPSGEGLHLCQAIHAEQNMLMQCSDVSKLETVYVTTFPCMHCFKMLLNTSCKRIFYMHDYPGSNAVRELNHLGDDRDGIEIYQFDPAGLVSTISSVASYLSESAARPE